MLSRNEKWWLFACVMFSFALMLFLPERNLWNGDGYSMRALFRDMSLLDVIAIKDGAFFIAPIPNILASVMGWVSLSYLCGIVYMIGVINLCRRFGVRFSILCFMPVVQMFAGYYEIYAPVYALTVWMYYYYECDNAGATALLGCAALLCHVVVGAPLMVLAILDSWKRGDGPVAGILTMLSLTYLILMLQFQRGDVFVPLTGSYALFSVYHLTEVAVILAYAIFWGFFTKGFSWNYWNAPPLFAAVVAVALVLVISPHLGMLRDWDLFQMATLPIAFLVLRSVKKVEWPAYVVTAWILAFIMIFNSQPHLEMYAAYATQADQYKLSYRNGRAAQVVAFIFEQEEGRPDLAQKIRVAVAEGK